MSRSYKKNPVCNEKKSKEDKRMANKRVRNWLREHPEEILDGSLFKTVYQTYDICDWSFYETFNQWYERSVKWAIIYGRPVPDKDEEYRKWWKYQKSK